VRLFSSTQHHVVEPANPKKKKSSLRYVNRIIVATRKQAPADALAVEYFPEGEAR
jgi:hypothetical protein